MQHPPGKRPAAAASGLQPDDFSWLLHLFLLAAGSEPDPAEPGSPVMAVTTRPAAILMVRVLFLKPPHTLAGDFWTLEFAEGRVSLLGSEVQSEHPIAPTTDRSVMLALCIKAPVMP